MEALSLCLGMTLAVWANRPCELRYRQTSSRLLVHSVFGCVPYVKVVEATAVCNIHWSSPTSTVVSLLDCTISNNSDGTIFFYTCLAKRIPARYNIRIFCLAHILLHVQTMSLACQDAALYAFNPCCRSTIPMSSPSSHCTDHFVVCSPATPRPKFVAGSLGTSKCVLLLWSTLGWGLSFTEAYLVTHTEPQLELGL